MKRLILSALALSALASCTKDPQATPTHNYRCTFVRQYYKEREVQVKDYYNKPSAWLDTVYKDVNFQSDSVSMKVSCIEIPDAK